MNKKLEKCIVCADLFDSLCEGVICMDRTSAGANPFGFTGVNIQIKKGLFDEMFAECEIKRYFGSTVTIVYAVYNSVMFSTVEEMSV
jgi:hypothetical protein